MSALSPPPRSPAGTTAHEGAGSEDQTSYASVMRRSLWLPLLASVFATVVTGESLAQTPTAGPPPWIPGLPVPVFLPANFPWGATSPVPGQPQPGQVVPQGTTQPLPALPQGAADGNGYLTVPFMQGEATQMLNDEVAALAPNRKAKVQGIPLVFDLQTGEVNAFAGCENGAPFMAITIPLLRAAGHIAEAKASDEVFGTQRVDSYTQQAAAAINAGAAIPDPPPGFYSPAEANDPRKLSRQRVVFNEMVGFILGHELGHHYLGHTGCANGDGHGAIDPSVVGRIASRVLPVFNQPNEVAADVSGTQNLLDVGVNRPGGLTEMGGVLTLQFFGSLQKLTPASVALGILKTHPQPQLRIPLIQSTAQQWRAGHANGQTPAPSNGLPFPFPFPLPFPFPGG
jgi:hypothetical protein